MAVIGFAGMSVAQDVYSSGYYTDANGNQGSVVFKNGTKLYNQGGSASQKRNSTDVDFYNGDVYWVDNTYNSDGTSFNYGDIFKNGSRWLSNPVSSGTHIYDLDRSTSGVLCSAGCKTISGVKTAVCWTNNNVTPQHQMGNGTYPSEAYGIVAPGAVLSYEMFTCGYQYSNSSTYHGVIWKNADVLHAFGNDTKIYGIDYYSGYLWTVGLSVEGSSNKLKVWKTDPDNGATNLVYTISESMGGSFVNERFSIHVDAAGDIYVNGMDNGYDRIYKNNEQYQSGAHFYNSMLANTSGVYSCGGQNSEGKIWKNGVLIYTPVVSSGINSTRITNIFVAEPECTNSQVRSLPFTENFENGNTSWPCWIKRDVDNNNNISAEGYYYPSYWSRTGKRVETPYAGNYCAGHQYGPSGIDQEGWLISPRLFLQPGQAETKLTFKTKENSSGTTSCSVLVSTTGTSSSNFTEVWSQSSFSNTWKTVTVDLSAYQGHAVYIAFKYSSNYGRNWFIDDVSVTEGFTPCSSFTAPYSCDFTDGFTGYPCWTAYDADMEGSTIGMYTFGWHYWPDEQCMFHHGSSTTTNQTGWLYSPRITLPSGNWNYTLSYRTRSGGSNGTGESHTVWVAVDKTGAYVPADYTQIYTESDYTNTWNERTVDLTPYKGHTVSIAFKYMGKGAHNWNIDDFAITKTVAQYTITANSNNEAWGTVSGGGPYDPGATCVLHAEPKPGYVFIEWRKNGTAVNINPNYSFTVTQDATYVGVFGEAPVVNYEITTEVVPAGAGTVTVAGGAIHEAGSTTTLEAIPNPGYTFAHWQDGNTDNPRTITVTGDATYTATFTQDNYTITTGVIPAGAGTVSVTGGTTNLHYGDVVTLTAVPATDYEFQAWQDGNDENPRTVTVTGNMSFTATFTETGTTMFNVTANVSPAGAGTVNGTGPFPAGASTILEAVANPGYTFSHWQDGSTTNPRTVTVTGDMSFTAYFTQNSYIITVVASPTNGGTVDGGGSYHYGDYANLTALAASGYEFQGWSDGSTANPHPVMVTGNATYTATFSPTGATYYTVSAYVSPAGAGTVDGTGSFPAGTTTTLTAIANSGYVFDHWNDGLTTATRTVTVNSNMSFTAYFTANQYTITVSASPANGGTVGGGGNYAYGAVATLTATPNTGFSFMQWSDGSTANPRSVTVTGNASYTALFLAEGGETFLLTVTTDNPLLGQAMGSGIYPAGASVEIRAIPASYARFVKWNDGNTQNPRTVVVNDNLEFIAEFVAVTQYTITVQSNNDEWGQAMGSGTYAEGTEVEISAIANTGYMFTGWQDGNTSNPRTITVTGNATYTAQFAENTMTTYTVMLLCNTAEGSVSGGGTYIGGTTTTIQAFPKPGYVFTKWSDENTSNPRTLTVNEDITLVAFFAVGIDENAQSDLRVYPNPAKDNIYIDGIEANTQVEIYNSLGELVKVVSVSENQEINVHDLASGLYLMRCGKATLRFIKEQ